MPARKRPSAGFPELFMKNETVIGTMGKTQGVSSAAKPQRIASMMSDQSEPLPAASLAGAASAAVPAVVEVSAAATLPEVAAVSLTRSVAAAGVATLSPPAGAAVASAAPP